LRDDRERFEEAGANVVLIGLGRPDQAGWFREQWDLPFDVVVSPDRKAHKAFGLRRGTYTQVSGPAVWAPWLKNQLSGKPQKSWGGMGDVAQLPGTFVVDTSGVVRYAHHGRRSNDLPPTDEILVAIAALDGKERAG
jgi:peroxiredoxin